MDVESGEYSVYNALPFRNPIRAHGGERIMPNSRPGGVNRATSNRTMNVTINARGGVSEILGELERFESMDDASFFNSV